MYNVHLMHTTFKTYLIQKVCYSLSSHEYIRLMNKFVNFILKHFFWRLLQLKHFFLMFLHCNRCGIRSCFRASDKIRKHFVLSYLSRCRTFKDIWEVAQDLGLILNWWTKSGLKLGLLKEKIIQFFMKVGLSKLSL